MNLNTKPVRMLVGAIIGAQMEATVAGSIPSGLGTQKDFVLLLGVVGYLAWGGRPSDGALGDVLDGIAVGIGAVTAERIVNIPGIPG